ncbi:MAG: copper amine oxidase N-terminal domain-containing protein [Clostridiales bacterium]|jgi:hypothetical protein|nr:copper amine oxidase N-terminal domain-containing protein [Clostridiales bacterium]
MKKIIAVLITLLMTLCAVTASAADEIKITIDGENLALDVMPVIVSDRTLVPIRAVVEKLGGTTDWDEAKKQVSIKKGSTSISLTLNDKNAVVNGSSVPLDLPAQIVNARTMIPLRFVAENLGVNVDWKDNAVIITTGDNATYEDKDEPEPTPSPISPVRENETVYWTPNGKSYHSTSDCRTLARSRKIQSGALSEAQNLGKRDPCNVCIR